MLLELARVVEVTRRSRDPNAAGEAILGLAIRVSRASSAFLASVDGDGLRWVLGATDVGEPFTMGDVASWTGARLLGGAPECVLRGVSTDTRAVLPGALFVAIHGPRHDAHSFLDAAVAGGAAGLLLERAEAVPTGSALPVAVVADTTAGLGALAAGHRRRFHGPVIAITGSNGKTTTKEMLAAILSVAGPCLKNRGNLNNQFGLPLTLLEREAEHRALVVEIGMNHRGEIAPLAAIAAPTVGVITNVNP